MGIEAGIDPTNLDAAWVTEAMEAAGVARGATVTAVVFEKFVGTGQMSRNARLRLVWDDPAGRPATVVGKFASDDASTRVGSFQSGVYRNECAFYQQVAPTVDVCTPACWVAYYDETTPDFVLLMEDLAGSTQGDQFTGCTDEELALAVEQAAALHGPRWGDPALAAVTALQPPEEGRDQLIARYYRAAVPICLSRLGHRLEADVIDLVERFGAVVDIWTRGPGSAPTVVHGDFRPDNFLFGHTPEAPPLAVVDWQTVHLGSGPTDVAYLLGGARPTEERRAIERDVVGEYGRRLHARGVEHSLDECWNDYRWGALHGIFIAVCATMTAQQTLRGDDMFTLMVTRHGRHALDLEVLDLVLTAGR